jgi:hypothetical protein
MIVELPVFLMTCRFWPMSCGASSMSCVCSAAEQADPSCPAHEAHSVAMRMDVGVACPVGSTGGRMKMGTVMTKALQDAFKEAEKLPESEQDELAAAIRAEIEAERAWEARLASSQGALSALADEALAEHRSGRTLPLDPDEQ